MGKNFNDLILELKKIRKDELDERSFFEEVLSIIKELKGINMTSKDYELLRITLLEIGCKKYSDWEKEKIERGEVVKDETLGEGIQKASIETSASMVSQLVSDYEDASFALDRMLNGFGSINSSFDGYNMVEQWLKRSKQFYLYRRAAKKVEVDKSKIPYYIVAKQALMNWNGLTEEESDKIIRQQSFSEIDGQVWAKGSMDYAIKEMSESVLADSPNGIRDLNEFVYNGKESDTIKKLKREAKVLEDEKLDLLERDNLKNKYNNEILDTLFAVHDGWVADNSKKFLAREKKHQHMPSELIGWNEVKADLLFVRPIYEGLGIPVNENELQKIYNERVKEFFLNNEIEKEEDLVDLISKGEEFYPALKGQDANIDYIKDKIIVKMSVIPQIEEKGIGKVSEVRKNILTEIKRTVRDQDLMRLNQLELLEIESDLRAELDELEEKGEAESEKYYATKIRLHKVANAREIVEQKARTNNSEEE